jgi:general secretion pathway protein C
MLLAHRLGMSSQWVVKKGAQLLPFVLVALAAYFQARGVSALLGSLVGSAGELGRVMGALAPAPARRPEPQSERAILTNNPFDSSRRSLAPEPEALADFSDPLAWPACEGVEVSIVTESSDPWWSLTTLRDAGEPRGRLRRVGDGVAGKQVAFIGYNPRQQAPSVWLEGGGGFCQSMLFRRPEVVASRAHQDSARVERAIVESTLADPSALMRSVRVVPDKQDGAIVGLKLLGIKPGSLLGTVGLRSGDRLESINGFSMNSPEKALQAYAQLRTAQRLNVRLLRRGQPVELTLNIN